MRNILCANVTLTTKPYLVAADRVRSSSSTKGGAVSGLVTSAQTGAEISEGKETMARLPSPAEPTKIPSEHAGWCMLRCRKLPKATVYISDSATIIQPSCILEYAALALDISISSLKPREMPHEMAILKERLSDPS